MEWIDRLNRGFFIDNRDISINHLKAFRHDYKARGNKIKCYIVIESHCVTKGVDRGTTGYQVPVSHLVLDKRGNQREFCFKRYKASLNLKGLLKDLVSHPFYRGDSGSENVYFVNLNKQDEHDIYKIIMNFSKSKDANSHVKITVESAFIQYRPGEVGYDASKAITLNKLKRLPKMKGDVVLDKAFRGEPIRFKRSNR